MENSFDFRGLEIHNNRMWRWSAVERAIDFMSETGMNALVFHQNDIIDNLVFPKKYFSQDIMYKRWPIRRSTIVSSQLYIRQVIRKAKSQGIDFYFQVKEIWYPESLLELFPQLRTAEGVVCPTDPFWFEFLQAKISELVEVFPDFAGIIISPATRESKISISTNYCNCERCQSTDKKDWYAHLLQAMNKPMAEKGKTLIVRDFSYTINEQSAVLDAAVTVSKDIVIALKNVPHDFWPTFPHNAKIGNVGEFRQIVEYDVWGQYCALGVFPCGLVEDVQYRLRHCKEKGVSGILYRTDWELINESSTFNSFNMVNLFAGAMMSRDLETPVEAIYKAWAQYGLTTSMHPESSWRENVVPTAPDAAERLQKFMTSGWSIIEKTLFARGHVFQYSSKLALSLNDFWYVLYSYHSRDQWDPGSSERIKLTDGNIKAIIAEKQEAVVEVAKLRSLLKPETLGVPQSFIADVDLTLDLFQYYVENFYYGARASFLAAKAIETGSAGDIRAARSAVEEMSTFRKKLAARLDDTLYPFYVYWLMDASLTQILEEDIVQRLDGIMVNV